MPDKTIEQLQAELDAANTTIASQSEEIDVINQVNADLQQKIEELELGALKSDNPKAVVAKKKPVVPQQSFTVDGEDYRFTVPQFTNPLEKHIHITAEEALTNPELLEHLVEIGFGGIVRDEE